jgi:hypothetical protein
MHQWSVELTIDCTDGRYRQCAATLFAETEAEARDDGGELGEALCRNVGYRLAGLRVSPAPIYRPIRETTSQAN